MANLAIRGHATRGKEVIEILEMLGGKNKYIYDGDLDIWYILASDTIITAIYLFAEKGFTLEEFLEKYPFKVGDKVLINDDKNDVYTVVSMIWDSDIKMVRYKLKNINGVILDDSLWYAHEMKFALKEETMEEKEERPVNHVYDVDIISFDIAQKDIYELDLKDKFHVILREGKYYVERIKPKYPKTYDECCKILNIRVNGNIAYTGNWVYGGEYLEKHLDVIRSFQKLKLCRDAYWKIAGEQLGLGKPWEPNWKDDSDKYFICYLKDELWISNIRDCNRFLIFPTEEMRDAFYENYQDSIEKCKELL